MAGGMDLGTPSGGKKKPLDVSINLVPFIDLMAVTISFLILTAVWSQVGRLEVSQSGPAKDSREAPSEPERELEVNLTRETVTIAIADARPVQLVAAEAHGAKLTEALRSAREAHAVGARVTLHADDDVRYEALIQLIDACIAAGMPDVTVSSG